MCGLRPSLRKSIYLFDVRCGCNVRTVRKVVERQINSVSRELRPRYRVGFLFSDAGNPVTAGREPKDEVLVSRSIGGPLVALRFINLASGTTLTKPAVSKSLRVGALTLLVSCCALQGVGSSRTPISLRSDSVAVPLRACHKISVSIFLQN